MEKKIFITGGSGMLGSYLIPILSESSEKYEIIAPKRRLFNVGNPDHWRIQMAHHKPDIIIHLAAMTDVDGCEKNTKEAVKNNILPSAMIAQYAPPGSTVLYMSASNVFGEHGRQIPEEDDKNFKPLSIYSVTKLGGEILLQEVNNKIGNIKHLIVLRAGWIYGGGKDDKKFIGKIYKQLKKGKEIIKAVDDVRGQPTYGKELAEFISTILDSVIPKSFNVFHYAPEGEASRKDIACELKELMAGQANMPNIEGCNNDLFKLEAKRPVRELIGTQKTLNYFGYVLSDWKHSLKRYYNEELINL